MSKSLEIAKKIVASVEPEQDDKGWRFDLFNLLGQSYLGIKIVDAEYDISFADGETAKGTRQEHAKTTKAEAVTIVAKQIAEQLDSGVLVLSDTFIEDHIGA